MPGVNLSGPLVGAGASYVNDVASAAASTGIEFDLSAEFNRGFKAEIGIKAFANANAGFSKFIDAQIKGTAFASARAGIQGQLALNLFKEFGFIVRADATAEAAAGIEAKLGIKVGDFINLVLQDKSNVGLPVELMLMLLDEVDIGASFNVDVSVSAKANCTVALSGTLLPKPGQQAGFNYIVSAGVGLAKGVGMGFKAGIGFKDFRRFYGRAIDRSVDEVIYQINSHIPANAKAVCPVVSAFGPVAKMSLRMSYDISKKIIENSVGRSADDAQTISNECVKIILEEIQRFTLEKLVELSFNELKSFILEGIDDALDGAWEAAIKERNDLANLLSSFPSEPFQVTTENVTYWKDLVLKAISLVEKLFPDLVVNSKLAEQITILYCATELALEAVRSKINKTTAYAVVIGGGTVNGDSKPFTGEVKDPPKFILKEINARKVGAASTKLGYVDLLEYLVDDVIIDNVLAKIPELKSFIDIFKTHFNESERELLKLFLENAESFVPNSGGLYVPKDSLRIFVNSIDSFLTTKFKAEVMTAVHKHITDPIIKTYIEEVFLACVISTKDIALNTALNWEKAKYSNDELTEALAGVMIMFLGRSIVLMTDTLLTSVQNELKSNSIRIAELIEKRDSSLPKEVRDMLQDQNVRRLIADSVKIGGEVLGPLPDETRKKVRYLLYQIFDTVPPGQEQILIDNFKNKKFIPNEDKINELCRELWDISVERFGLFAEKFLVKVGQFIIDALEDLWQNLVDLALNWERNLAEALTTIANELRTIEARRVALNKALITQYGAFERAFGDLIAKLKGAEIKRTIKNDLVNKFIVGAETELNKNDFYKLMPKQGKDAAKGALRSTVDLLLNNPVIDPIFDAMDDIGDELDDLLPDMKRLDSTGNMPAQFMDLLLDNIERKVRHHFRRNKPGITIGLKFNYVIPAILFVQAQTINVDIPLGKIEIDLTWFINKIREVIEASDIYQTQLNNAIVKLGNHTATTLEIAATELKKLDQQKRQTAISKINTELTNRPKEVKIISPTHLAVYQNSVAIKVQLLGVPTSYLGLNTDELQRLHIFINGKSIPIRSFSITNTTAGMMLQFSPLVTDLIAGVNVLSVALIDKAGAINKQNLSFMILKNAVGGAKATAVSNTTSLAENAMMTISKTQMIANINATKNLANEQILLTFKNIK